MSTFPPALPEQDLITTTSATDTFQCNSDFVERLRLLRQLRRERKLELRERWSDSLFRAANEKRFLPRQADDDGY
jgi:hypothetical protein